MNNRVNDTVLDLDGHEIGGLKIQPALRGPEGVTERVAEIREMVEAGERLPMNTEYILGTNILGVRNTGGQDPRDIARMFAAVAGLMNVCGNNERYAGLVSELKGEMLLREKQGGIQVQKGMNLGQ